MTAVVTYLENALTPQRRPLLELAEPRSILSLAPDWQTPYVAFVDGSPVLRAEWELVLEDGQALAFVDVRAIPQGGGGGGSNPIGAILMIAVMVVAPYLAPALYGAMGGTLVMANAGLIISGMTVAIGLVGAALVSALIAPPQPTSPQTATALAAASPTYNLQAQGNSARLEAAIPEHFGRMLAYPDFAAMPYQEYAGNEQYVYQLLCIGRGYYDIEAIRIEDTPIANFDEISYEVIQPGGVPSLFPANVVSSVEVSGQTLTTGDYVGGFIAASAGTLANFIGIDFVAPRGLYYANDDGSLAAMSISAVVEARQVNDFGVAITGWVTLTSGTVYGPWSDWSTTSGPGTNTATTEYRTDVFESYTYNGDTTEVGPTIISYLIRTRSASVGGENFAGATTTPQRYSRRYSVAPGRYEVRVKRTDTEQTSTRYGHGLAWAGLRSYLQDNRSFGDVTLLALRMRATNNLSMQSSRKLNVIATRKLPTWNGSSWSANTATRSIAWPLVYAAKQIGMTDAQIDLAELLALDATWAARGDRFDGRFDSFVSFWEAITKIAGAGRAKPYMQGGVLRIFRDQAASVPVALFSMRNIIKGSFNVQYLMPTTDTADAVNVGYFDETTWAPQRVQAKLPGSTAARPVKVELFGVTGRSQAFREGMKLAADNRYRRKLISFDTEMEGFIPSFGDLIAIQHDMPAWGQGGEIAAWDAGTTTATLSEAPTWGTGTHYIGLRKRDGSIAGPYVVTAGALPNQVVLAQAPGFTPYVGGAEERTHYSFGWAETWRQLARVLSAKPQGLYRVAIECVNEDNNVHTAETGVVVPAMVTSQLAGYTNAPTISGLSAHPAPFMPSNLLIEWQPSAWANSYLVEQSKDGIAWTRCGNPAGNNFTTQKLYGSATLVRVAAVGFSRGPWTQVAVTPSPGPQDVSQITRDGLKLSWPAVSDQDIVGYRIKFNYGVNQEWGTANALYDGLASSSPYTMLIAPPGQVTIMARAVDSEGRESANSAYLVTNLGDPLVANVLESYDFKAAAWPGTTANASVIGGNLQATQSDVFYKADTSNFYPLDGAAFYSSNYDALEWISSGWTPALAAVGSTLTAAWNLTGNSVNVQYRQTGPGRFYGEDLSMFYAPDDVAFYAPAGVWMTWPGGIVATNQEYQWRVTTAAGAASGLLSAFTVSSDVPDKITKLNSVVIAAGGTRLVGAVGLFNVIQNVQLTLQGGSTAATLEIQDYSPSLGPRITAKNSAGTGVTATIDALLQGY